MSHPFKLASGVRAEIREAADWYRERDPQVAIRFIASVDRAIRRVVQWPNAGSPVEGTRSGTMIRRVPVGRFPYQVVYASVDGTISSWPSHTITAAPAIGLGVCLALRDQRHRVSTSYLTVSPRPRSQVGKDCLIGGNPILAVATISFSPMRMEPTR